VPGRASASPGGTGRGPAGVPWAPFGLGKPGAANAGLFAAAMLAADHAGIRAALAAFRARQTSDVLDQLDPRPA